MIMKELALHVLDIVQNSISAKADTVEIAEIVSHEEDKLTIIIKDNGCGMDEDMQKHVIDPFTTSRTTRKVGLGIPFFKLGAEACDGEFSLRSTPGEGTEISASYRISHIDRPPMGDMAETILTTVVTNENVRFIYALDVDGRVFRFDTGEIRDTLGYDIPLSTPDVVQWMSDYLKQGIEELNGGI